MSEESLTLKNRKKQNGERNVFWIRRDSKPIYGAGKIFENWGNVVGLQKFEKMKVKYVIHL